MLGLGHKGPGRASLAAAAHGETFIHETRRPLKGVRGLVRTIRTAWKVLTKLGVNLGLIIATMVE